MASADANNTGTDPELDARFSNLDMTGATVPLDETTSAYQTASDPGSSSFWPAQDPSFSTPPQAPTYGTLGPLPLNNPLLAAQANLAQQHFDYGGYTHETPSHGDWQQSDDAAQAGPSSGPPTTADKPFRCPYDGCAKSYPRQCDLDKHMNNHSKRRRCDLCPAGKAETKDLNRHMWTNHPTEAMLRGIPKDHDECPQCGYSGRKDNVKRHKDMKGHW